MKRIWTSGLSLALLAGGLVAVAPAQPAAALPQPAITPCERDTPLESDFDGDGRADLIGSGQAGTRVIWVVPADGGPAISYRSAPNNDEDDMGAAELVSADLNGDRCADAILFRVGDRPWIKLIPGEPSGLDFDSAAATTVTLPQAAKAKAAHQVLMFHATGTRHDGISQVAIAGIPAEALDWEAPPESDGFIDVFTIDGSLAVTSTQVLHFPKASLNTPCALFSCVIVADGRTIAIGVSTAKVNGKRRAGAVRLYTAAPTAPYRITLRRILTQDSPGIPGAAEEDDGFGSIIALRDGRLAVGAKSETIGRKAWNAGVVQPIAWDATSGKYAAYRPITQDTRGVPGKVAASNFFGSSLSIARGLTATGSYDILIGAHDAAGGEAIAGSVTVANFTHPKYLRITEADAGGRDALGAGHGFSYVGVLRNASGADTVLISAPGFIGGPGPYYKPSTVYRSDAKRLSSRTTWTKVPPPADAPADLQRWMAINP